MIGDYRVSLVMPCRNEGGHLDIIVKEVPDFFDQIICVSNKSTDSTVEVGRRISETNEKFTLLIDNRVADGIGYGYAHMSGIEAANGDIIVCADADGTYPIEDSINIVREMEARGLDFVSGNRYPDARIPLKLQLGVKILNAEICLLYAFPIKDSLSGMWVFRRSCVDKLNLTEGDWNLSPQIKLNARKYLKNKFAEIKVNQKIRHGETKQDYFKTGFSHVMWILKNRFVQRNEIQPCDKSR